MGFILFASKKINKTDSDLFLATIVPKWFGHSCILFCFSRVQAEFLSYCFPDINSYKLIPIVLRKFVVNCFKIYMIAPIFSVVRVACDRLGRVSIRSSRSSGHFLETTGTIIWKPGLQETIEIHSILMGTTTTWVNRNVYNASYGTIADLFLLNWIANCPIACIALLENFISM